MGDILFNYGPGTQYPRVSEKNHTQITWVGAGGEEGAVQRTDINNKKKKTEKQLATLPPDAEPNLGNLIKSQIGGCTSGGIQLIKKLSLNEAGWDVQERWGDDDVCSNGRIDSMRGF